ncbi:MAG: hypothetical protein SOZ72_04650 [Treponema sp.]|uniref:hypothetical protein n=1 Tax=Enterobacteriaceae TaxID=543 RepID=UPI0020CE85FA|nr:hypothetical protein [Klebsiella pneumoniae]ELO9329826.1 hypothetical protein [Escherichia coli]MDY3758649.1 hypothetical protein [Treponema sp.]ELX1807353.1 hypothetical protein [Escherichia coli]MCQ0719738.1 hypothetical protein [Klebsiella pneumoniae]HDZ3076723.1 hypothetical protein [Klebsiella pneumoniae]
MSNSTSDKGKCIYISKVEVAEKFASTSIKFGYDEETQESYDDDLLDLQTEWEKNGYIEIYDSAVHGDRAVYPLAKDSNKTPGSSPHYTGLYHARLLSDSSPDPLVIVTFQGATVDPDRYEKAVIEAMIYHDLMFLPKGKKNPEKMKNQGSWVRSKLEDKN